MARTARAKAIDAVPARPSAPADDCSTFSAEAQADLIDRLKRIEGQVRGIQRMVDEGRNCRAILNQLTAVRAAAYQVSVLLVRDYASQCLRDSEESKTIDELVQTLNQLPY
jgi:DNA-binding FrmR family transcriptional regulator